MERDEQKNAGGLEATSFGRFMETAFGALNSQKGLGSLCRSKSAWATSGQVAAAVMIYENRELQLTVYSNRDILS